GKLVRVLAEPPLPVLDAHLPQHARRPPPRLSARYAEVRAQRLGHEVADPPHRVDMRTGILEHHRYPIPVRAELTAPERADVPPGEPDLPLHPGAGRQQPADRARRHRLARARLAHQADRLAR